jgi:hypothetical protein
LRQWATSTRQNRTGSGWIGVELERLSLQLAGFIGDCGKFREPTGPVNRNCNRELQ